MRNVAIGQRLVGDGQPVFIIAEIGSNHDGKLDQAKLLIEAAAAAGADAVKFQSFTAAGLVNPKERNSQGLWIESADFDILRKLELPGEWYQELFEYAVEQGLLFLSTPFDEERADLLAGIGVPAFKIASGDLTHHPLLRHIAQFQRPIILSTGLAYLGEVEEALRIIYEEGNENVILLHCVSNYPAQFKDANIRALVTMREAFRVPVGYSDHSPGYVIPLGAVALGACVIEKHLTLDKDLSGPDHAHSMDVTEFGAMVAAIRSLSEGLGSGLKRPVHAELPERKWARRGIYAQRDVSAGCIITREMLSTVRPCEGVESKHVGQVVGAIAQRSIKQHEPITWDMIA